MYYTIYYSIERTLEDHEVVIDAVSHWPRDHNNHVLFKNNPEKYYLIKRPQVCAPFISVMLTFYTLAFDAVKACLFKYQSY